jgi:hypothetical protein
MQRKETHCFEEPRNLPVALGAAPVCRTAQQNHRFSKFIFSNKVTAISCVAGPARKN